MPEKTEHPSHEQLSAYNLGQLPPEEAVAIESHISECEPCCDTIVSLSSDDTFVGLLKEAKQLPTDQTLDHVAATASSSTQDVPAQLAEHPRYEIVRLIGKGGMGDVYEARHRKMERTVALKVINRGLVQKTEAVDRFHREVKAAAQLSHPNIVTAYDADQAADFHFMVMEHVDGVDLSQKVKAQGALTVADACDYIRQAAIGLQHAHERGMVHRDIKPHNLMVTSDGMVKILDFGLASLAPEAIADADTVEARGDLTVAGAIMGTPDFISPEQASDAREADIRSDIYSLGATFYYLLSGRVPFGDGSVTQKLKDHAQLEPEALNRLREDIPADLLAIVSRMMAKDPDDRFQTPAEVGEAIGALASASEHTESRQVEVSATTTKTGNSSRRIAIAMMLSVVSLLGAGALWHIFLSDNDDSPDVARQAYADAKSQLDPTNSTGDPANAVRALLTDKHGREYLLKLDRELENFAYDDRFAFDGESAGAVFIWNRNQDDGSRHKQMLLRSFSKNRSGKGYSAGMPHQIHLKSVRIEEGKLVIGYVASDRAQDKLSIEALGLIPGAAYEVSVDVLDLIKDRTDWIEPFKRGKRTVADGTNIKSKDQLVGEWVWTEPVPGSDELRVNFRSNGTFELIHFDLAMPIRVQMRATGTYTADFSVSPAHLDMDGTSIRPAFDRESELALATDGAAGDASEVVGPERERVKKYKLETIIELLDDNTLHTGDLEAESRPKTFFDDRTMVWRRQGATRVAPTPHRVPAILGDGPGEADASVAADSEEFSRATPFSYDLSRVPANAREIYGFRPRAIHSDSRFASLWNVLQRSPLAPVVDHRLAEVLSVKLPYEDGTLMPAAMIMTLAEGHAREFALRALSDNTDIREGASHALYYPARQRDRLFQIVDNKTILMGTREALNKSGMHAVSLKRPPRSLARQPNRELLKIAASMQDGQFFAIGNNSDKRFLQIVKQQGSKHPIGTVMTSHIPLWQDTSYLTLSLSVGDNPQLHCSAHALTAEKQDVITQTMKVLRFSLANLIQSMTTIGESPLDRTSTDVVIAGLREAEVAEPSETETLLTVSLKEAEPHFFKILNSYFIDLENAKTAAFKAASVNNLRQIGQAFILFETEHGYLPSVTTKLPGAKHSVSWRVAILKYLDEDLYNQYKLDEPWYSVHNKSLVEKMPSFYRHPGQESGVTKTCYVTLVGENTATGNGETPITDNDIARTILVTEGYTRIPWTKPEDLLFDDETTLPSRRPHRDGWNLLFVDGSTHFISSETSTDVRKSLIKRNGVKEIENENGVWKKENPKDNKTTPSEAKQQ